MESKRGGTRACPEEKRKKGGKLGIFERKENARETERKRRRKRGRRRKRRRKKKKEEEKAEEDEDAWRKKRNVDKRQMKRKGKEGIQVTK